MLLSDHVREMASAYPDEVAWRVVDVGELTFGDWDRTSNRAARAFVERGVEPGDRIALLLDDRDAIVYLQAYTGAHKAGAIATIVNVRFSPSEVVELLRHAEPALVVVSAGHRDLVEDLGDDVEVVTTSSWDGFLDDDDADIQVEIDDDAPADVIYTGGTTGMPKGVLSRHDNTAQMDLGAPDDWRGTYWLFGSPLASLAGQSFVHTQSALGMTVLFLPPPFDPERWLDLVEDEEVVGTFLAPVMVEQLLGTERIAEADLSSLLIVSVGSAPIAPASLSRLNDLLPNATPQNNYSLTEIGGGVTSIPDDRFEEKLGSVGRPVDPFEVRIVDPESGEEVPAGEVGEVLASMPDHREYFRDDGRNAETFQDGWMWTGDLGRLDEEGFLSIVGRLDDLIIRGGFNVHPPEVEEAIYELDDVKEAAVVGEPHEELGEDVVAAVVPVGGADLTAGDVTAFLDDRLGEPLRPSRVKIVDELPRNPSGKVLKQELSESLRH